MDVWKKFDSTELSHSGIHHLLAIHELKEELGYARSVDVSKKLNISRGSTSITLRKLKERGYLDEDENKFYSLTPPAVELIEETLAVREVVRKFFLKVLELPDDIAREDSCKIEHLISSQTADSLVNFMAYILKDEEEIRNFRNGFREFVKNKKKKK